MLFAAQLCTLTVIVSRLVCLEPGIPHKTRNGILLDAKSGNHEAVNHIVGGGDDAHLLAHRHHQWIVDPQQIVIGGIAHIPTAGHRAVTAVDGG
ncbi:hypothetical protein D3C72_1990520 [compost metagenome]